MLLETARELPCNGRLPDHHCNAIIEAFALHFRNVYQFIYHRQRQDDVVAEAFFKDRRLWKLARGKAPKVLRDSYRQANEQVAHLTTKRTHDPEEKHWEVRQIVAAIEPLMTRFIESVDGELLDVKWKDAGAAEQ